MNKLNENVWLEMVTDYGCVITGRCDIQRHHVVGKTYKKNKIHIGTAFILPLVTHLHDVHSNHPLNVTHFRHDFTAKYGSQRDLFYSMCEKMTDRGETLPFDDDVLNAIMDTNH